MRAPRVYLLGCDEARVSRDVKTRRAIDSGRVNVGGEGGIVSSSVTDSGGDPGCGGGGVTGRTVEYATRGTPPSTRRKSRRHAVP